MTENKCYEVTVAKTGSVVIAAPDKNIAMEKAYSVPESDIAWCPMEATDAELLPDTEPESSEKTIPLRKLIPLMESSDQNILYLSANNHRTSDKETITVKNALSAYGDRLVSQVYPYIHTDGEYVGNVYVIPDLQPRIYIPEETAKKPTYIMNTMPMEYETPTWRIRDTAWFQETGTREPNECTITAVSQSDKGTFMTVNCCDNGKTVTLPMSALFLTKEETTSHANGTVSAYDVQMVMTGYARVIAHDKTTAAKLAREFLADITWEKPIVQKITKETD